jgi:hypothetical protein
VTGTAAWTSGAVDLPGTLGALGGVSVTDVAPTPDQWFAGTPWALEVQRWALRHGAPVPQRWDEAAFIAASQGAAVLGRSTDEPVSSWIQRLVETNGAERFTGLVQIAEFGVAPSDAYALSRRRDGAPFPPGGVADQLPYWLGRIATQCPRVGVRDAIGWTLAIGFTWAARASLMSPWIRLGAGADRWVYAAAGITPAEYAEATAAGTLTSDQARLLAGLRGVTLPVG